MKLQKIQSELQRLQYKLDIKFDEATNRKIEALLKKRDESEEQSSKETA